MTQVLRCLQQALDTGRLTVLPCLHFPVHSCLLLRTPSNTTWSQDMQADLAASCTNMLMAYVNAHLLLI